MKINNIYLLCADSDAKIIMSVGGLCSSTWWGYRELHFVRDPLVVMLTLAKIKEAKGQCNVNFYLLHICLNLIYHWIIHVTIIFFADKYPPSVQNIKHGSKLYVNIDIAEIQQFRNRYDNNMKFFIYSLYKTLILWVHQCNLRVPFYVGGVTDEGSVSQSQYSQHSQRNSLKKFLHNAQMVSLGEISRLREVTSWSFKWISILIGPQYS